MLRERAMLEAGRRKRLVKRQNTSITDDTGGASPTASSGGAPTDSPNGVGGIVGSTATATGTGDGNAGDVGQDTVPTTNPTSSSSSVGVNPNLKTLTGTDSKIRVFSVTTRPVPPTTTILSDGRTSVISSSVSYTFLRTQAFPTSLSSSESASSSAPSSSSNASQGGAKKSNTGAIAGGVVAGVVVLFLAIFGFFLLRRRQRRRASTYPTRPQAGGWTSEPEHKTPVATSTFKEGASVEEGHGGGALAYSAPAAAGSGGGGGGYSGGAGGGQESRWETQTPSYDPARATTASDARGGAQAGGGRWGDGVL